MPTANGNILTDPAATFAAYDIFDAKTDESGSERTDAECAEWVGAEWPTEIDAALIKINRWLVGSESAGIAGNTTTLLGNLTLSGANNSLTVGDGSGTPFIVINKDGAGSGDLRFQSDSVIRTTVRLDGGEDLVFQARDGAGAVQYTTTYTNANGGWTFPSAVNITGALNHDGSTVGFYGTTPATQSAAYTRNATVVEDRTLLASASATATNNNNVLAAIIADLQAIGILG